MNYSIEHYGIYTRPLTFKLIILKEESLECLDILKPNRDQLREMQFWAIRLGIELATCCISLNRSRLGHKISGHSRFSSFWNMNCLICRALFHFRFLATGVSYKTIRFSFRVGASTVSGIVEETCEVLPTCLSSTYMKMPTEDEWWALSERFKNK